MLETLRNEYRQFREMTRLFFARFVENDLICLDGDTRGTLVGILTILIAPGVFLPLIEYLQFTTMSWRPLWFRDIASLPDKGLYLAFSMTVLGIMTVLEWEALLPDKRDYSVLRPFPIRLSTVFGAKIASLAGFWAVFTVAINIVPAAVFPVAVAQKAPFGALAWMTWCHALAIVAANAFMFLAMIAAQGVLMNVLGWRRFRRAAPYAQLVLVAWLLVTFFLSIASAPRMQPRMPADPLWHALPPLWFLGLYQRELGWTQQVYRDMAANALQGLAIAAGVAALVYLLSYRRSVARSLEDVEGPAAAPGRLSGLPIALIDRVLLRSPAERASFHFVRQTLTQSRSHRVLVAAYAGAGFALVFHGVAGVVLSGVRGWWQSPKGLLLPVPLVLALFLLSGMRYAFTVPAELRANWLFRISGNGAPAEYMAGVRKAAVMLGVVPLFALLLPIYVAMWGWTAGGLHVLYGATIAWLLVEALLANFDKLPFTCSFVPGRANLKAWWPVYILGYLAYVAAFSFIELRILAQPARFFWFLLAAVAVKLAVDRHRRAVQKGEFALVYDDSPEPAVTTLELQQ